MPEFDSPAVRALVDRARTPLDAGSVNHEVSRVLAKGGLSGRDRAHLLLAQLVLMQGTLSSEEATVRANEVVRLLQAEPDSEMLASALAIAATICGAAGDHAACVDHCLAMSSVIRSTPGLTVSARASANFGAALIVLGAYDLAIPLFVSAARSCIADGEQAGAVFSCTNLAIALSRKLLVAGKPFAREAGDLQCLDVIDDTLAKVRATKPAQEMGAFIDGTLAYSAMLRGDLVSASEHWGDLDALTAHGSQSFNQYFCLVEAPIAVHRGDFDRAHKLIEATLEVLETPHIVPLGRVDALRIRSALHERTGHLEAALSDEREATAGALIETNGLADLLISQVDKRAALEQNQRALLDQATELTEQTLIDELSQVGNRRAYEAHVESIRKGPAEAVSVVLCDIDRFKAVNDEHGHTFGDQVIRRVGSLVSSIADQSGGRVFRYGGDEFVVVAPGSAGAAVRLAEQIRSGFVDHAWGSSEVPLEITCSVGIWSGQSSAVADGLSVADGQMYAAKDAGRNVVRPTLAAS